MWSKKYSKCIVCGTIDIKHVAKGMCKKCYTINTEAEHKKHQRHKKGVAEGFLTKEKLIELYLEKRMSLTDIGKLAGCTRVNVHYKLKRFGIEARSKAEARTIALDQGKIKTTRMDELGHEEEITFQKIRYNKKFFKEWSAEMAYILGLIYTDGNLHVRKAKSGYELGILSFAQKDKELVEKFLNLMDCDAKIRFRKKRRYKNITSGEIYYFAIGNNDIANDLMKLGITPKKSLDMNFPEVPDEYLRHFVRGLFDGDGSVYIESHKYIRVKLLSGSKIFIDSLNNRLHAVGFPNRPVYGGTKSTKNAFFIRYNKDKDVVQFFDFIYLNVNESMYYSIKKELFQNHYTIL